MVVSVILTSDETYLTNFSRDKKAWPLYLTIRNLPSTVRNKPSRLATVLLALLPVPPKIGDVTPLVAKQYAGMKADVHHRVLQAILQPLKDVGKDGINIECADFQTHRCFPILAAWLADHMEYVALYHIKADSCPVCEVKKDQLGMSLVELLVDSRRPV